ncbi:MAG: CDP-alcohol phosphatidyltransferase family protein [Pseudomonadota bacterium]
MQSLYALKPGFQAILRPLVARIARAGITANFVTLASLAICAAYGALLAATGSKAALLSLPAILLLRMALNAIDGMLAREHAQASALGGRLNEFGDVLSDICLYLPFAVFGVPPALVVLVVLTGILAEFAGVASHTHGGLRSYAGPFGKSDRAAFFALIAVALALFKPPAIVIAGLFVLAAAGGLLTTFNRLMCGARSCRN